MSFSLSSYIPSFINQIQIYKRNWVGTEMAQYNLRGKAFIMKWRVKRLCSTKSVIHLMYRHLCGVCFWIKGRQSTNEFFTDGFRVNLNIKLTGTVFVYDVTWCRFHGFHHGSPLRHTGKLSFHSHQKGKCNFSVLGLVWEFFNFYTIG